MAIASTIALVLLLDIIVLQEIQGDQLIVRFCIATAIVASTSTIATAFLIQRNWKQSKSWAMPASGRDAEPAYAIVAITCPRCNQNSSLPVGDSACPACGLKFRIEIKQMIV